VTLTPVEYHTHIAAVAEKRSTTMCCQMKDHPLIPNKKREKNTKSELGSRLQAKCVKLKCITWMYFTQKKHM
jgi:hypothetical protein